MRYALRTHSAPDSLTTMTQQPTWAATLAPIGQPDPTGRTIDPACVITVREGAPLLAPNGTPIGRVTGASIIDGHLVVTGTLDPDQDLPNALPTFDADDPNGHAEALSELRADDPDGWLSA